MHMRWVRKMCHNVCRITPLVTCHKYMHIREVSRKSLKTLIASQSRVKFSHTQIMRLKSMKKLRWLEMHNIFIMMTAVVNCGCVEWFSIFVCYLIELPFMLFLGDSYSLYWLIWSYTVSSVEGNLTLEPWPKWDCARSVQDHNRYFAESWRKKRRFMMSYIEWNMFSVLWKTLRFYLLLDHNTVLYFGLTWWRTDT